MIDLKAKELRVLVLAPSGRDAPLLENLLESNGVTAHRCASVEKLYEEMQSGPGAVVVASEVLNRRVITDLAEILGRQPAWSDLPIIVITVSGGGVNHGGQLRELGELTNATILERPVRSLTILNAINIALRARARQYVLRDHLIERTRLEMKLADAYQKQYRIAETLQQSVLSPSTKNAFTGVQLETLYVASKEEADVGGDFFDAFAVDKDRTAIVVGDVSGKGLEAAVRSLEVKYPLRAFLRLTASPSGALNRLNESLIEAQQLDHPETPGFVCLCICIFDISTRTLTWSSGGFEGPLIIGPGGRHILLENFGTPIGVVPDEIYDEKCIRLGKEETVLLFTDGITESRWGRDFFGIEGVISCINGQETSDLAHIVRLIAQSASKFAHDRTADDVCVVAARLAETVTESKEQC